MKLEPPLQRERWYVEAGEPLAPFSRWLERTRTYLTSTYRDKEAIKEKSGGVDVNFDGGRKQWYVRGGVDLRPYARWMP